MQEETQHPASISLEASFIAPAPVAPPALPPAQPQSAPATPAAHARSVSDILIGVLAREFEQQGFSSRSAVASMSEEQMRVVVESALSGGAFLGALQGHDLCAALLPDVAAAGRVEQCRGLLKAGASPDARNQMGMTALVLAGKNGHVSCVELLLQSHADVRASAPDGTTALHAACAAAEEEVAIVLLEGGALLSAATTDCRQPLELLSPSGFRALPVRYGGGASEGPPFPADHEPWRTRPGPGFSYDELMAAHREMTAVRLARYAAGALASSALEMGRDRSFPEVYGTRCWSEATHHLFPEPFRLVVRMLLLHAARCADGQTGWASLPPELVLAVCRRMTRDWVREGADEVREHERRVPRRSEPHFDERPVMLRGWPGGVTCEWP